MDELLFTLETLCENHAQDCIGRALIKTFVRRLTELAYAGKIDEAKLNLLTNVTFARCVDARLEKDSADSAFSKAAYCDNPAPSDVLKELRQERGDAERELQDALTSLCAVALELLRA